MTHDICDVCFVDIHRPAVGNRPEDEKFRVDLSRPGATRGFDVCKDCYTKIAELMKTW